MIRVLYVDDDDMLREIVVLALERHPDISVTATASGAEAVSIARSSRFDIVLLDARMPEMDGPVVLAALRSDSATRDIPVAFLTGRVDAETTARLRSLGAVGVVAKPFKPAALVDAICAWAMPERVGQ